eukprot:bmy_06497T0
MSGDLPADLLTSKSGRQETACEGVQPGVRVADPGVLCRWQDPVGDAGAELPAPKAASRDQHRLYNKGRTPGLPGAREESVHLVRHFYKGEEIFLDMFEDEYRSMTMKPMNVEYLMMDASILLPPTGTPLTGIDFVKRLPCGDVEKTRRAIRVFFMLRSLSLQLRGQPETQLPLTREEDLIKTDDVLDLSELVTPSHGGGDTTRLAHALLRGSCATCMLYWD